MVIIVIIISMILFGMYRMIITTYFRNKDDNISYNVLLKHFIQKVSENNYYMNYGYWGEDTKTLYEANKNLIKLVLEKSKMSEKKGIKILDVGCGYGEQDIEWSNQIDKSNKITAVDISEEQINNATNKKSDVKFEVCDAEEIDIKYNNEKFDTIISLESAFHYKKRNKFYNNVNKLLSEDGKFIITDLMLRKDCCNGIIMRMMIYIFSEFLCIPKDNLINEEEWEKNLLSELNVEESIDITEKTFEPYYKNFMVNYFKNSEIMGKLFSIFFCEYQPFAYKIVICSKKK
jgi:cyclopropane fatty-acyl-phospholipid synthase-like methyltransferase